MAKTTCPILTCPFAYIYRKKKGGIWIERKKGRTKIPKPEQMWAACGEYFSQCDESGRKPTWQGLAGHLGVSSRRLNLWLKGEGAVSETLRKAADAISDRLQQRTDSMAVLSVKQPLYGGFLERAQAGGGDGQLRIVVTVDGRGDGQAQEFGG